MTGPVLTVEQLTVRTRRQELVSQVGFTLGRGERVGLIGESGSGKTLTATALMGLLPEELHASGSVRLASSPADLMGMGERQRSGVRGRAMSMVFQEPMTALNPLMRVGAQVAEIMRIHGTVRARRGALTAAVDLLEKVGLPDPPAAGRRYPHQLSGGQRQRVMLAMALANRPEVLICDEPTTALDVTVQARMLELITRGVAARDAALLFITHDLPVVATVCDRVLVMHDGRVVESGPVTRVFTEPAHDYTRRLLAASDLKTASRQAAVGNPEPPAASGQAGEPLVQVTDLRRAFRPPRTSLLRRPSPVAALEGVSFELRAGERFGIVGESGSGKSTLLRLLAALDTPTSGSIRFDGQEVAGQSERELKQFRADVQMVFQDPMGSLDPRMRVQQIVAEPLVAHNRPDRPARVRELLDAVGLPADAADRYPHQFSGGQRQRIAIARALALRPRLLLADEPVSALDVSVQAQVLDLLESLAEQFGLTMVFVSHDLSVVRRVCDTIAVMHQGRVVESGPADMVSTAPEHPYTRSLVAAIPTLRRALAGVTAADLASGVTAPDAHNPDS